MSTEIFENPRFYNKGSAGSILLHFHQIIQQKWQGTLTPPAQATGRQDGEWATWTGTVQAQNDALDNDEHFGPATRAAISSSLRRGTDLDDYVGVYHLSGPSVYKGDDDEFFHFSPPQPRWFQEHTLRDGPTLKEAARDVTIVPKVIGREMYLGGGDGSNRIRNDDWDFIKRSAVGDEVIVLASHKRETLRDGTSSWSSKIEEESLRSVLLKPQQSPYDLVSMCEFWPGMTLVFEA